MSYLSTQYATLVASLLAFLMIASSGPLKAVQGRSVNLPSPQCHPSIINSMPPKIRKICDALSTIWEFSEAMESYLDEKGTMPPKKKNPAHSIALYWLDFQSPNSHLFSMIFTKILSKSCCSWLHAYFDTFWVKNWPNKFEIMFNEIVVLTIFLVFSIFCEIFKDRFLIRNLISQFGLKRRQKKHEVINYKILKDFS